MQAAATAVVTVVATDAIRIRIGIWRERERGIAMVAQRRLQVWLAQSPWTEAAGVRG
jgi:hypothetical protein